MFKDYYTSKEQHVPINFALKQKLAQELFQVKTNKNWLSYLRLPILTLVSTGVIAVLCFTVVFKDTTKPVSAKELLTSATEKMIPAVEPGQAFHVKKMVIVNGLSNETVEIWSDGKNMRTEETLANGKKIEHLAVLRDTGFSYEYTHYDYDAQQPDHVNQSIAPGPSLMQSNGVLTNYPTVAAQESAMVSWEQEQAFLNDSFTNKFISQTSGQDYSVNTVQPPAMIAVQAQPVLVDSADLGFEGNCDTPPAGLPVFVNLSAQTFSKVGEENIGGTMYTKIKADYFAGPNSNQYSVFWINQITGRIAKEELITNNQITGTIYYTPGEIMLVPTNFFKAAQWLSDYQLATKVINSVPFIDQVNQDPNAELSNLTNSAQ